MILQLQPLASVKKSLQDESLTVSDSRAYLDAVIENFSDTTDRLTSSAGIVHSPTLDSALVKIQRGNATALSREEKYARSNTLIEEIKNTEESDDGMSFALKALKPQKLNDKNKAQKYMVVPS